MTQFSFLPHERREKISKKKTFTNLGFSATGFYCARDAHLGHRYVRLGACKSDEGLDVAVERLRKLRPLLVHR